ncbi:MAG TPA: hypothetical protein VJV79_24010 [Polyangiaceae bacterium]|nr:hypothetical protein [Polyangiaceae bacterium]
MKFCSKAAALGSLVLAVVVACGRAEDDNGGAGGPAGGSAGSGVAASGGKLGVGGSSLAGASGKGGSTTTGGSSGEGNAANTGGSIVLDAGAGGTGNDSVPLGEGSWDTTLALSVTKAGPGANINCTAAQFTLHLSPSGNDLKAISGRDGAVLVGELIRDAQGSPRYSVSKPLPVPTRGDCALSSIEITEITLQAWDESGDALADIIGGSGKARGNLILGDQGFTIELSFTLQGVPDATPPSLLAPSTLHPLDGVLLRTTEPVAVTSSVTLTNTDSGSASHTLTGYTASNGAFGSFSSPLNLPFGSSWKLTATGTDLAKHPFAIGALPPLAVLADPGLFAQDGFEGTPTLSLTGSAKIVTAVGTLPAIKGNQSLFVPSGSSATLHVARPTSANSVRFTAQLLTDIASSGNGVLDVQAGVIGGSLRVQATQGLPAEPSIGTNDSTWMHASPTQEVTLPLTESGADVAIRFAPPVCRGLCPPLRALLIDDLRVE